MNRMFKTKDEYCHIFEDKLIITKTPEINDLLEDYRKSVNNVFKTLMVFFISIPIFSVLAIVFYKMDNIGLAINTGAFGLFLLVIPYYIMLFTSGSPLIKKESIKKIKIQKNLLNNVVCISYKKFGREKKRHLIIDNEQVDTVKNLLLSENLIEIKDIELKNNRIDLLVYIIMFIIIVPTYTLIWKEMTNNVQTILANYGTIIIISTSILLLIILRKLISRIYYKTTNR